MYKRERIKERYTTLKNKKEFDRQCRRKSKNEDEKESKKVERVSLPTTVNFLRKYYKKFSNKDIISDYKKENGSKIEIFVPECFTLSSDNQIDNDKSIHFLKTMFDILYNNRSKKLFINYKDCKNLHPDASVLMDLILVGFIEYFKKSKKPKIQQISPVNYEAKEISEILFSIGAYRNIKEIEIFNKNVTPFPLIVGNNYSKEAKDDKEIHETKIVDYVEKCFKEMGIVLKPETESKLSKVVGEVIANAQEHSKFKYRYAIGYFRKSVQNAPNDSLGVFKLVIFNFGNTIYQSFGEDCKNQKVKKEMKTLSNYYTKKRLLFFKGKFQEESLWTLYALQEKVTSTLTRRGNGSIRFIDCFFQLKGDNNKDNFSKLTLISGNTRIVFDGTYPLREVKKNNSIYKMMTFNKEGNINKEPDKKFVIFTENFFPGTMISANIYFTHKNIENEK